ncbi:hypothetical protein QR680_011188 [Steinernema hermaphroditum]|uniref:PHD-type domain-containing protein n=1 Tax=Steinernema hermaphroditum TaxID=289476 RepID=A0AA39IRD8_9BILA|nr:hypothetical protein QR680_011188 [Steinernema hermaphroditum]
MYAYRYIPLLLLLSLAILAEDSRNKTQLAVDPRDIGNTTEHAGKIDKRTKTKIDCILFDGCYESFLFPVTSFPEQQFCTSVLSVDMTQKEKLYCICQGPDDGSKMIACDGCNEWFHCRCIRFKESMEAETFFCRECRKKKPKMEKPQKANQPAAKKAKKPKKEEQEEEKEEEKGDVKYFQELKATCREILLAEGMTELIPHLDCLEMSEDFAWPNLANY